MVYTINYLLYRISYMNTLNDIYRIYIKYTTYYICIYTKYSILYIQYITYTLPITYTEIRLRPPVYFRETRL